MNNEENYMLTKEGFEKIEKELEELKSVKRKEVSDKLKVARSFGDLSENAEYDEAKNAQAQLEERIAKLENIIRNAQVVEDENADKDVITVGSTAKVKIKYPDGETDNEEYTVVGSTESDLVNGKISNDSPIGKAMLGAKEGDSVEVIVPDGIAKLKIVKILK